MSDPRKPKLDDRQQQAVHAEENSIVTAGAGSGKTLVLSQRFLELLTSSKAQIDEILALTFTRKAAVEMRERIHRELTAVKDRPDIARQLTRFDSAEISTIDSFCARVLRSDSLRYGIPPSFTQDNDRCEELARQQALEYLGATGDDPAVSFLASRLSFEDILERVLVAFSVSHSSMSSPADPGDMHRRMLGFLWEQLEDAAGKLEEAITHGREYEREGGKLVHQGADSLDQAAALLDGMPWMASRELPGEQDFKQALEELRQIGKIKKSQGKQPLAVFLKESADIFNAALDTLFQTVLLLSVQQEHFQFYRWLAGYEKCFHRAKRRAEVLSFKDVAELAVDILRENRELRRWYKHAYRYIMIDEFQDNNSQQKDLLYLLSETFRREGEGIPRVEDLEPGKLFFVGDEKQSVYRFRGADVSVFKTLKGELTEHGGRAIELTHNYRSDRPLIELFNRLFSRIMGTGNPPWAADFSELQAGRTDGTFEKPVTLFYYPYQEEKESEDGQEELSADEAEAWYIARRLKEEVSNQQCRIRGEDGASRPLQYDDIALLLRKTSNQRIYEQALRRLGIPYTTDAPRALFQEAPVNDLYLFLQTVAYPADRGAYAGLLRSPFCNISDRAVLAVLSQELSPFDLSDKTVLSADDAKAFKRSQELYRQICSQADRIPIEELLAELWYRGGYRYSLLRSSEYHSYLEYYQYLRLLARTFDQRGGGLTDFTDYLRPLLGRNKKIQEVTLLRKHASGVRIMTVHKAKGLEFPVVVFANAGGGTRDDSQADVYFSRAGTPVLSMLETRTDRWKRENLFLSVERAQVEEEEEAELKRLVYVAFTRAEQWCILSGAHNRNNRNSSNPLNMFLNSLDIAPGEVTAEELDSRGIGFEIIPDETEEGRIKQTLRPEIRNPAEQKKRFEQASLRYAERQEDSTTVTKLQQELRVQGQLPADSQREEQEGDPLVFGELCHRLIAHAVSCGSLPDDSSALPGGISPDMLSRWDEGIALAEGFLSSPEGKRLRLAETVEPEVPFVMRSGDGKLIHGQIDLLVVWKEEGEVIEFKTDRSFHPSDHELQLKMYCEAAGHITGKPVKGMLYYLRTGRKWNLK